MFLLILFVLCVNIRIICLLFVYYIKFFLLFWGILFIEGSEYRYLCLFMIIYNYIVKLCNMLYNFLYIVNYLDVIDIVFIELLIID